MKSLLALLTAITLVFSTSGVSFAAFTSDGTATFPASASVGGTPGVTVGFSASLKNISGDTAATSVTWTGITAGSTAWKACNQYVQVNGFATYSDWGIQVYTDNKNVSASPKYTGTTDPAGLVRADNTIYGLPMCWRTTTAKLAAVAQELEIYQGTSGGYAVLYDGIAGHEPGGASPYFPWFFMLDKGTPDVDAVTAGNQAFGNYQAEATFIGSAGYHHAPGAGLNYATPLAPTTTYYVYMGAGFTLATPGKTYSTSTITAEMYHL